MNDILARAEHRQETDAKRVRRWAAELKKRGGARLTVKFERIELQLLRGLMLPGESLAATVRRVVMDEVRRMAGVPPR